MRQRALAMAVGAAMVATTLSAISAEPAAAHGTHTSSPNDSTGDFIVRSTVDLTPIQVRVIYPVVCSPACTPESPVRTSGPDTNGWPMMVDLHGGSYSRCYGGGTEWAKHGYVTVTFNARGHTPGSQAGVNDCGLVDDTKDSIDDEGTDVAARLDMADIKDVINGTLSLLSPTGCDASPPGASNSTCYIDRNHIGLTGFSYGGWRAWLAGAPGSGLAGNGPGQIKAIIPSGPGLISSTVPAAVARDETGSPLLLDVQPHHWIDFYQSQGFQVHMKSDVVRGWAEWIKGRYLGTPVPSVNSTGCFSTSSDVLTISGAPAFTTDVQGKTITVAGAGPSGATLVTTVTPTGFISGTQAHLATTPLSTVSCPGAKRVSWGPQGEMDARSVLDANNDIDKVHVSSGDYAWTTPTFVSLGVLDGNAFVPFAQNVEAWKAIPSTTHKFLHVGSCGHGPGDCSATNAGTMFAKMHAFADRYVRMDTTVDVVGKTTNTNTTINGTWTVTVGSGSTFEPNDKGKTLVITNGNSSCNAPFTTTIQTYNSANSVNVSPTPGNCAGVRSSTWSCPPTNCVFWAMPKLWTDDDNNPICDPAVTPATPCNGDGWVFKENVSWPPSHSTTESNYFHWNKTSGNGTTTCNSATGCLDLTAPAGSETTSRSFTTSPVTPGGSGMIDFCATELFGTAGYTSGQFETYETLPLSARKLVKVEADLVLSSATSNRLQVMVDLFEVKSGGTVVRINPVQAFLVPVKRTGYTSPNKTHFIFQPTNGVWNLAANSKIRVRVASQYTGYHYAEPLPDTYSIWHDTGSNQSKINFTYAA